MRVRKISLLACVTVLLAACSTDSPPPGQVAASATQPPAVSAAELGFDPAELSSTVRPQDDFFQYVNGDWSNSTDIPAEWSRYGVSQIVYEETEQQLKALIESASGTDPAPDDFSTHKIGDLYASFMNEQVVEELGIGPLTTELERISELRTHDDLIQYMGYALQTGIQGPVNFYVDADAADTDRSLAYIWQDGLGLPDRDYYLSDSEQLQGIREKYVVHIEHMFELAGWEGGAEAAQQIPAIEKRIAEQHWSRVQNRDRERIYRNKFSIEAADKLSPGFDWAAFLQAGGFGNPEQFIIAQTDYFAKLGSILRSTPLDQWKTYLRFKALKAFAPYLNYAIVEEDFEFQKRTLRGQEKIRSRWKRGVRLVNNSLGEMVGELYVAQHFHSESKESIDTMIANLRESFRQSINSLEWMSDTTKEAAQQKLAKFTSKIGYPDKWKDYSKLLIAPNDLVGNVRRSNMFTHAREMEKLTKPVDRTEWGMTPQTVNAYYRPTMNEIVFPAAILQGPYFDARVDDAVNYGAIGSVIGHEFSHGFDDQGRKFDGRGELADWWTEADATVYEERSAGLVAQYDEFQPLPDQNINGALTLGENIADLAGVIVAYRAWKILQDGTEIPTIHGFTGDQRFFIGYAQAWRSKQREESLRENLLSNPHSPPDYRVVGVLRNVPEFYTAFDVKEGDGMYLAPEERVKIW
jgi:putative endopeptidase